MIYLSHLPYLLFLEPLSSRYLTSPIGLLILLYFSLLFSITLSFCVTFWDISSTLSSILSTCLLLLSYFNFWEHFLILHMYFFFNRTFFFLSGCNYFHYTIDINEGFFKTYFLSSEFAFASVVFVCLLILIPSFHIMGYLKMSCNPWLSVCV